VQLMRLQYSFYTTLFLTVSQSHHVQEHNDEGGLQGHAGRGRSFFTTYIHPSRRLLLPLCTQEYDDEGGYRETPGEGAVQPARLRYSYYTAGSGGVGPTILETSMLLAGEEVVAFRDGEKVRTGVELVLEKG